MNSLAVLVGVQLFVLGVVESAIPSYIHVCKGNDPNLNSCIKNSVIELLPKLEKGIPELDVPALEPLYLREIVASHGPFKAVGHDVYVRGASHFEIQDLKANVKDLEFQVALFLPFLKFDAVYDVNARILGTPINGKGPLVANTTDVEGRAILKGHKEKRNGKTYVKFDSLELKLRMKNYNIRLENINNGDKALGDVINAALNENKKELMQMIRPAAEQIASKILLEIANKITQHFEYDELFPTK